MKKTAIKISIIVFIIFLLLSCSQFRDSYRIRIRMSSTAFDNPVIMINVEGGDGDAIESALVRVRDPGNRVYILDYLSEYGAYRKVLGSRLSGTYTFNIESILDSSPQLIEVEHDILTTAPVILNISDENGSNTENGDSLDSSAKINIAWTDLGSHLVYAVIINSGINTIYQTTSSVPSCIIAENNLPASSNLSVSISAVSQHGDPELKTENYFSVNSIDGSPYVFSTD